MVQLGGRIHSENVPAEHDFIYIPNNVINQKIMPTILQSYTLPVISIPYSLSHFLFIFTEHLKGAVPSPTAMPNACVLVPQKLWKNIRSKNILTISIEQQFYFGAEVITQYKSTFTSFIRQPPQNIKQNSFQRVEETGQWCCSLWSLHRITDRLPDSSNTSSSLTIFEPFASSALSSPPSSVKFLSFHWFSSSIDTPSFLSPFL